jgi:hypothetical protein
MCWRLIGFDEVVMLRETSAVEQLPASCDGVSMPFILLGSRGLSTSHELDGHWYSPDPAREFVVSPMARILS